MMKLISSTVVASVLSLGALLITSLSATARPATVITDSNVRSAASLKSQVLETLSPNSPIEVLNIVLAQDGDYWYYVRSEIEGTPEGWVRSNLVRFIPDNKVYGTLAGDRDDKINIRKAPNLNSAVLHYGLSGDVVAVGDTYRAPGAYSWRWVTFPNQASGWVRSDLIHLDSEY